MRRRWLGAVAVVAALAPACGRGPPTAPTSASEGRTFVSTGGNAAVHVDPYATDDPSALAGDTWQCTSASLASCTPANWSTWGTAAQAPATTTTTARQPAPVGQLAPAQPIDTTAPATPPFTNTTAPPPSDTTTLAPPVAAAPVTTAPVATTTTVAPTTTTRPPRAGKKH